MVLDLFKVFFLLYHGKSPSKHHLGECCFLFSKHLKQIQVLVRAYTLQKKMTAKHHNSSPNHFLPEIPRMQIGVIFWGPSSDYFRECIINDSLPGDSQ